jgi:hypothetical protein
MSYRFEAHHEEDAWYHLQPCLWEWATPVVMVHVQMAGSGCRDYACFELTAHHHYASDRHRTVGCPEVQVKAREVVLCSLGEAKARALELGGLVASLAERLP